MHASVHPLMVFKLSLQTNSSYQRVIIVVGFLRHLFHLVQMDLCRLFLFQQSLLWKELLLGEVSKWHWLVIFVFVVLFVFSTLIMSNSDMDVLSLYMN